MRSLEILNQETLQLLIKNNLLESLIQKELVREAVSSIELKESEIISIKNDFHQLNKITSDEEYNQFLERSNISDEDLIQRVSEPIKLKKYCKNKFSHRSHAQFLKRKNDLDRVIYSLIRVKDIFEANELYQRIIESEANFGDLAKEFSLGPEKDSRGIVGPVYLNQSHPILSEVIRSNTNGIVVKPFKIESLCLILRVETLIEATMDKDIEVAMENELFQEYLKEKIDLVMKDLKSNFNITN